MTLMDCRAPVHGNVDGRRELHGKSKDECQKSGPVSDKKRESRDDLMDFLERKNLFRRHQNLSASSHYQERLYGFPRVWPAMLQVGSASTTL